MTPRTCSIAGLLLALTFGRADAQSLAIGDAAPTLAGARFLKGEKVETFEPDRTYVVDFFPINKKVGLNSIPRLTAVRHRYRDRPLTIIGIPIAVADEAKVEPFVESMGEDMDYSVALDTRPGYEGGEIVERWAIAAGLTRFPAAFLIKVGKVAWVGPTSEVAEAVEASFAPDYDLARSTAELRARQAEQRLLEGKLQAFRKKIEIVGDDISEKQRLRLYDKAIADEPRLEKLLRVEKYQLLRQVDRDSADAYLRRLMDESTPEDLASLAYSLSPYRPGPFPFSSRPDEELPAGIQVARRANDLTKGQSATCNAALAWANYVNGYQGEAIERQEKAVKLSKDVDREAMKNVLESYRRGENPF